MIANYYKPGPGTESGVRDRIAQPSSRGDGDEGHWYVSGNYVVCSDSVTNDNWQGVDGDNLIKLDEPWDAMPINQQTAEQAYETVLADVGCTMPNRDSLDARIVEEVRTGTAAFGNNGFINNPDDAGGYPTLNSTEPPTDSDHDGMPDDWETANGLDPNNADDRNQTWGPGYTMLEKYLNSLDSF